MAIHGMAADTATTPQSTASNRSSHPILVNPASTRISMAVMITPTPLTVTIPWLPYTGNGTELNTSSTTSRCADSEPE